MVRTCVVNHSLLTIDVARARGLEIAGVVLNEPEVVVDPQLARSNATEITRRSGVPVPAYCPHGGSQLLDVSSGDVLTVDWFSLARCAE